MQLSLSSKAGMLPAVPTPNAYPQPRNRLVTDLTISAFRDPSVTRLAGRAQMG